MAKPVRGKACRSKTEGPCSGELNRCLGRAHALPSPLLYSAHSAPPHPAYLFGPTSELLPPEVCLVSGHGKEACSCAYGASHARANEFRVACIGFWLLSVLLSPCHCRSSGAHVGPLGLLQRERWSAQRRVASHASGGGHGGRRGMEARAAVACLGAHRRSPEAGERTLVAPKTKQAGHLFPVRRPPLKPP